MKAMGAKQRDILQIALAEFGALGLVASITSLFVAIGFSAYVSIQIFSNENFNEFGVLSKKVARERFAVSEMAKRTVEMYSRVLPLPDGESLRGGEG